MHWRICIRLFACTKHEQLTNLRDMICKAVHKLHNGSVLFWIENRSRMESDWFFEGEVETVSMRVEIAFASRMHGGWNALQD